MWDDQNAVEQPFYALLGASVTFEGSRYSLSLWGRILLVHNMTRFISFL